MSSTAPVKGRESTGVHSNEAYRIIASSKSGYYSGLSTTLSTGATDTALTALTGGGTFFSVLPTSKANYLEIFSDQTITLKFRTVQNIDTATGSLKTIKVRANTSRSIDWIADVTEVYLSNSSGSTANIDLSAI